jgi:hypothetical protein
MNQDQDGPKLHIDSDWKAEAQAEKERLAHEEKKKAQAREAASDARKLPEASFATLMGMLASQAIMGLGAVQDQKSGGVVIDLEGARFAIDLLAVVEEKTKGNLTDEETKELQQVLRELRGRFVQIADLIARQAVAGGPEAAGAASTAGEGAPPLHT